MQGSPLAQRLSLDEGNIIKLLDQFRNVRKMLFKTQVKSIDFNKLIKIWEKTKGVRELEVNFNLLTIESIKYS